MSKKSAKPEATGAAAENTRDTDNPAVTSESTTKPATAAADGGSADSAASDDSTIEAAQTGTTSPQPKTTGAAADGGAGATDKPKATSKASVKALYVVGACPVLHDHEVYQPGDKLELTAAEAARLNGKVAATKA